MPRRIILILIFLLVVPASIFAASDVFVLQSKCVLCHLLGKNDAQGNPVIRWKRSVHYRSDSKCADCHGGEEFLFLDFKKGHIGTPQKREFINLCGECHSEAKADTLNRATGEPGQYNCTITCTDCHGYHKVSKPSGDLIGKSNCGRCHPYDRVQSLRESVTSGRESITSIEQKIELYKQHSFPVQSSQRELNNIRKEFSRSFHSQPPGKIEVAMADVEVSAADLNGRMDNNSPRKWYIQGGMVLLFLSAVFLLISRYQTTITESCAGEGASENARKTINPSKKHHGKGGADEPKK